MSSHKYLLFLVIFTSIAVVINATYPAITVNNQFVIYALIVCVNVIILLHIYVQHNRLLRTILQLTAVMTGFAFILVPLYNVFCDVTGLNGKLDLSIAAAIPSGIDYTRSITVEFVVNNNQSMPWEFKPKHHSVVVHPGQLITTAYFAKNPKYSTMYAQAIPSISPSQASKYFKKVECFCFSRQKLGPGESAHLGLRFYLDPAIPKDLQRITLAYTIFDITKQER